MQALTQEQINAKLNIPDGCHLVLKDMHDGTKKRFISNFESKVFNTNKIESFLEPITFNYKKMEFSMSIRFICGRVGYFICGFGNDYYRDNKESFNYKN